MELLIWRRHRGGHYTAQAGRSATEFAATVTRVSTKPDVWRYEITTHGLPLDAGQGPDLHDVMSLVERTYGHVESAAQGK